jgi:dienelactone hydrolase
MFSAFFLLRSALFFVFASALCAQETAPPATGHQPPDPLAQVTPDLSSSRLAPQIKEDFSTPALTISNLSPVEPLPLEADDFGSFRREVVRVEWRPGDPIDLYIVRPAGVTKPPAILYLYTYPFETDRFLDNTFCDFLVRDGVAAVGFASALTGSRYRTGRPMKEWFVSELGESLATTSHDVQMILNYMNDLGDFDMNRVGMFGDGSGASIAILAAAVDPRIKTLDLLDPWADWPDWVAKTSRIPEREKPNFMKPEWLAAVAGLDPILWLPRLKTKSIRIQFIENSSISPTEVQLKIQSAAPVNAQVVHFNDSAAYKAAVADGTGFNWVKQQVRRPAAQHYRADRNSRPGNSAAIAIRSQQQ